MLAKNTILKILMGKYDTYIIGTYLNLILPVQSGGALHNRETVNLS